MAKYILITYLDGESRNKVGIWSESIEDGIKKFLRLKPNITIDDIEKAGVWHRGPDENLGILANNYSELITADDQSGVIYKMKTGT